MTPVHLPYHPFRSSTLSWISKTRASFSRWSIVRMMPSFSKSRTTWKIETDGMASGRESFDPSFTGPRSCWNHFRRTKKREMLMSILFRCCRAFAKPYGWLRRWLLLQFLVPFYVSVDDVSKINLLLLHSTLQETRAILTKMEAQLAPDCYIENHLFIHNGRPNYANLSIASQAYVGKDCFFDLSDQIIIDSSVVIAMRVTILTHFAAGASQLAQ